MPRSAHARKERKSYTLSRSAVSILEAEMRERRTESVSAALEELLQERRRQKEMRQAAAAISSYYDSLSEEEEKELQNWGKFSESQFPLE